MNLIRHQTELKRDHPVHYWLRLLMASWIALSLLSTGLVRAADSPDDEIQLMEGSSITGHGHEFGAFCRQLNGTLWAFSVHRDLVDYTVRSLYGWFSTDNGTSWNDPIVIASDTDVGYEVNGYPVKVENAMVLTNNSIILCIYDVDYWGSSGKQEVTFLCHWNNSDLGQWERVNGYSNPTYSATNLGSNVNATDKIAYGFRSYSSNYMRVYTFDPATRTCVQKTYVNNRYPLSRCYLEWNGTAWELMFDYEPGTGVQLYCYGIENSPLSLAGDLEWQLGLGTDYMASDVVLSSTGVHAVAKQYTYGSYDYTWLYVYFRNATGTVTTRQLNTDAYWGGTKIGMSNADGDYFTVTSFNYYTDRISSWGSIYWKSNAHWQGTQSDNFEDDYDFPNTLLGTQPCEMPNALYPVDPETGNHTQLPATLGFPYYVLEDYDNTGSYDYDFWADLDGTWPGVLHWTYEDVVPGGPGPGGNDTSTDTSTLDATWWSGTCTSGLFTMIAIAVLVLSVIFGARRY